MIRQGCWSACHNTTICVNPSHRLLDTSQTGDFLLQPGHCTKSLSTWAHLHSWNPLLPSDPRGTSKFCISPQCEVWAALLLLRRSVWCMHHPGKLVPSSLVLYLSLAVAVCGHHFLFKWSTDLCCSQMRGRRVALHPSWTSSHKMLHHVLITGAW